MRKPEQDGGHRGIAALTVGRARQGRPQACKPFPCVPEIAGRPNMAGVKGDRWQWRGEEEEWSAEARTGPGRIRFAKHFRLCDQVLMLSLISFCDIWNYC